MTVVAILGPMPSTRNMRIKLLNPLRQLRDRFMSLTQSRFQLLYLLNFVRTLIVPEVAQKYDLLALLRS